MSQAAGASGAQSQRRAASLRGLREAETRPVNVQRFADAQRDAWVEAHGWRGIDGIGWGKDRNRMGKSLKIL